MTKDNPALDALLPCPFCGGQPTKGLTKKTGCQMHGDPIQYAIIGCLSCEPKPSFRGGCVYRGGDKPKFKKEAYEEAAIKWNTRPQPSGDAVDGKDYKKLYWDLLESWSDLKIKHGVLQEKLEAALTQPKADVDLMAKLNKEELDHMRTIEQRDHAQDMADKLAQVISDFSGIEIGEHSNLNCPWENALEIDLAAQGYIGGGWKDISTIPDNLMSGVDLWDDREEKRYINCTFDLRVQAWADERSDFVKIPTHWMPLPAAPKKEGE